jgi:16S rRNA (uracil1498-N3)-methyltransferase
MAISRIYQAMTLTVGAQVELEEQASHHLARVLRAEIGDIVTVFNGEGGEYETVITAIAKKKINVNIKSYLARDAESPLQLYLAQGISRGEKMDFTIQKAVELGVSGIIPLLTERCTVKLDDEKRQKRLAHWQSIVISACEQSGRNTLPTLLAPVTFHHWLASQATHQGFVLAPLGQYKLQQASLQKNMPVTLLIGPEGGLSEQEIKQACQQGFLSLNLGPRILRTETAGLAALAAIQSIFGDLGG